MKPTIIKSLFCSALLIALFSCSDYDEKTPYPKFSTGVSLRPLPSPWTARPRLSLAQPGNAITLSMFSYNADELQKVDIYVSYLNNVAPPAASGAGTATYANYIAPVGTAGMLMPQFPDSGSSPVTISYARYDQLIKGVAGGASFTPMPRSLFKTLTGSEITSAQTFTLTELASKTGITLPSTVSTTIANQPAFILIFEVTKNDGSVFSYANSGPGVVSNPATGKALPHTYNDTSVTPAVSRSYTLIVNGDEGSPFIPGVAIRVAP